MEFYVKATLIKMNPNLSFRRRLQNHGGYFLVSIPPAVAKSLKCKDVDLLIGHNVIQIVPAREVC
jgi:hypothetical protein